MSVLYLGTLKNLKEMAYFPLFQKLSLFKTKEQVHVFKKTTHQEVTGQP